ncbi:MAG: UDP-N-acetylmuramate dehydrogenase [Desulfobacteraceae bacterium]|nr:UDP-N-acetylmuramate dehydrogenase [Desulfobacteraceae bacterium]
METATKLKNSYKELKENFSLLSDEPMKNHTSIKIGGPADLFAMPETQNEFVNLIKIARKENIPLTVIGDGTNLLIKDKGIRGLVISTSRFKQDIKTTRIDPETSIITTASGTKLSVLCNYAIENNLQGIEFAAGIPGTVGGAVAMNAGTPESSISEIINSIKIITDKGKIKKFNKTDLNFSYRKLNNISGIIIESSFLLKSGDKEQIKTTFNKNLNNKKATQPFSLKSAGCIFKNPRKTEPAGKLIDMAGLKNAKIGDAIVSEKHANFILNLGNAKCEDILRLKELIEKKILNLYSVRLETEIVIKGE